MPAEISVVIPTLQAAADLPDCLAALGEGLSGGLIREVIVSDGGSQDETPGIAQAAGAVVVIGAASRGGQLRRGCALARGRWLLILHADTVLSPGWARAVADHVADPRAGPAHFRLVFRAAGVRPWLVAGWANQRALLFGLPFGDQGLLVQRDDYDRAGGYPDQPLMEDVALIRALERRVLALPVRATTSAERYSRDGWLRRGARNLWTQARYFAGADPETLFRSYQRWP
ncbi:MAG: TIGR04283 family arsenosugar biosynthesis glycosyltransferase [Rhodobacteraceae bacterium]|nr:TIGR04283 family arsenosugar biosynthesis glycosyltransferase [Paracoccaceae bacterium]